MVTHEILGLDDLKAAAQSNFDPRVPSEKGLGNRRAL
jgi:hypothetical protein